MLGARAARWSAWISGIRRSRCASTTFPADRVSTRVSVVIAPKSADSAVRLLVSLADPRRAQPLEVVVVDARTQRVAPLESLPGVRTRVVEAEGCGASAARNLGVRAATGDWVVLLDDDAVIDGSWYDHLVADLRRAGRNAAGVLAATAGATSRSTQLGADVAYRRLVLLALGGFQERFPRDGCQPDVELAQRMSRAGWDVVPGTRSASGVDP